MLIRLLKFIIKFLPCLIMMLIFSACPKFIFEKDYCDPVEPYDVTFSLNFPIIDHKSETPLVGAQMEIYSYQMTYSGTDYNCDWKTVNIKKETITADADGILSYVIVHNYKSEADFSIIQVRASHPGYSNGAKEFRPDVTQSITEVARLLNLDDL